MSLHRPAHRAVSGARALPFGALSVAILAGTACAEPVFTPVDAALDASTGVDTKAGDTDAGGLFDGSRPGDSLGDGSAPSDGSSLGDGGNATPPAGGSTMDASAFDGGTDATPSFCHGVPGVLICDDFEGNLSRWAADTNLGTVERDLTRGYQSGASFKSELTGSGRAQLRVQLPNTVADGVTLYAQMRVFFPNKPLNHVAIGWLGGVQGTSLMLQDWNPADSQVEFNLFPWNTTHKDWIGSTQLEPDKWSCLDIRIALDEKSETAMPNGAFEARIDGEVVITTSTPIFSFEPSGPFDFALGLSAAKEDQGAFTAWFDDVVIATAPLPPCSAQVPTLSDAGAGVDAGADASGG